MPLFPLRRVPFAKFASNFSPSVRFSSRRSYYGYISDSKMAPQLEPFFKQYVRLSSLPLQTLTFL
jgi:Cys-Gly metallodipeptidase DUG1